MANDADTPSRNDLSTVIRWTAAVVLALALIVALLVTGFNPALRFRLLGDARSMGKILATRVHNGDTCDAVAALLGRPDRSLDAKTRQSAGKFMARTPSLYPEGIRPEDEFVTWWSKDGVGVDLQFRNGRLVNHNPDSYRQLKPMLIETAK